MYNAFVVFSRKCQHFSYFIFPHNGISDPVVLLDLALSLDQVTTEDPLPVALAIAMGLIWSQILEPCKTDNQLSFVYLVNAEVLYDEIISNYIRQSQIMIQKISKTTQIEPVANEN